MKGGSDYQCFRRTRSMHSNNLAFRRLGNETTCPKCENGCKTLEHVFRDCVIVKEVWGELEIGWLQNLSTVKYTEWIIYLLENGTGG